MANKLTEKQEKFAMRVVENGGDQSEAYRYAYNASNMKPETINRNACESMKNNKIAARVEELQAEKNKIIEEKFKISITEVVKDVVEVKDRCMQREQVMKYNRKTKEFESVTQEVLDSEGNPYQAEIWAFDSQGALKALDMLMKHKGGYEKDNVQKKPEFNFADYNNKIDELINAAKHNKTG